MTTVSPPGRQDWVLLMGLALLWGTAFLFIRFSLDTQPPAAVAFVRLALGAVILYAYARSRGRQLPALNDTRWIFFALLGFFGNALPFFLIPLGQTQIPSALAGILLSVMPLMTVFLAHIFTPEKMTRWKMVGFVIGLVGAIILIGPSALAGLGGHNLLFQVFILCAAVSYAVNVILTRNAPDTPPSVLAAGTLICASIWSLPLGVWQMSQASLPAGLLGWSSLIWLGIGPTAIATVLYMQIIRRTGAAFMAQINYLVPIVALFTGLAFGEAISWNAYIGLLIILAGIGLARRN